MECCDVQFPNDGRLLPVATVSHYTEKLCEFVLLSQGLSPPLSCYMLSFETINLSVGALHYVWNDVYGYVPSAVHTYQHCTHTHAQVS